MEDLYCSIHAPSKASKMVKQFLKDNAIPRKRKNPRVRWIIYLFLDPATETAIKNMPEKEGLAAFRRGLELSPEKYVVEQTAKVEAQNAKIEYRNALFDFKVNGISAVIQAAILFRAAESAWAENASTETTLRWASGAFTLGGTILAGFESATKTFPSLKAVAGKLWVRIPIYAGRVFIFVAGAISVVYDFKNGLDEWSKGNKGMVFLYGMSSISMAYLTWVGATGKGNPYAIFTALVVYFFAQYFIAIYSDNEVQKWLQRCMWGKNSDIDLIPFNTFEQEQTEFNKLIEETV